MMLVVKIGDSFTKRLDASGRTVFTSIERNINGLWPLETALNVIVDLWGSLAQIGPFLRFVEVAVLVGSF